MRSSDEIAVSMVPAAQIDGVWPRIAPWLQAGLDQGDGEYALADLEDYVRHGFAHLFVSADPDGLMAAAVVQCVDFPRKRIAHVTVAGGRAMAGIGAMWPLVQSYARGMGCDLVRFCGRRGWARVGSGIMPAGWRHQQDVVSLAVEA